MKTLRDSTRPGHRQAAFSLVEIALALGIVGFALVGIVGAIPVALNNERLSVAQTRAAGLANTIFTNLRTQPFGTAQYLDTKDITLNLNVLKSGDTSTFYAAFDEMVPTVPTTDQRRLHFTDKVPLTAPYYKIVLRFDNNPSGTLAPYQGTSGAKHAQANAVEASISESDRVNDVFRFSSVIANRSE